MNAQEYAEYEQSVESGLEGLLAVSSGSCHACNDCNPDNTPDEEWSGDFDPCFSWSSCECCNSHLGGDRYPAHAIIPKDGTPDSPLDGELIHLNVCSDCYYYLADGHDWMT